MYGIVLDLHSLLRWIAVLLALAATASAASAWAGGRALGGAQARVGAWFVAALDLQLLVGLLLYAVLSPVTRAAFAGVGAAARDPVLRYWLLEHPLAALAAVALAHVGRVLSRREPAGGAARRAALLFGASTVALLAAVPWPALPAGRPLLPF